MFRKIVVCVVSLFVLASPVRAEEYPLVDISLSSGLGVFHRNGLIQERENGEIYVQNGAKILLQSTYAFADFSCDFTWEDHGVQESANIALFTSEARNPDDRSKLAAGVEIRINTAGGVTIADIATGKELAKADSSELKSGTWYRLTIIPSREKVQVNITKKGRKESLIKTGILEASLGELVYHGHGLALYNEVGEDPKELTAAFFKGAQVHIEPQ